MLLLSSIECDGVICYSTYTLQMNCLSCTAVLPNHFHGKECVFTDTTFVLCHDYGLISQDISGIYAEKRDSLMSSDSH